MGTAVAAALPARGSFDHSRAYRARLVAARCVRPRVEAGCLLDEFVRYVGPGLSARTRWGGGSAEDL